MIKIFFLKVKFKYWEKEEEKSLSKEVTIYRFHLPDSKSLGFKASFSPFAKERRYPSKNPWQSSIGMSSHFTNIESEEVSSTVKFGARFGAVRRIMKEKASKINPSTKCRIWVSVASVLSEAWHVQLFLEYLSLTLKNIENTEQVTLQRYKFIALLVINYCNIIY